MKNLFKQMFLAFTIFTSLLSCNTEELFVEKVSDIEIVEAVEDGSNEDKIYEEAVDPSLPCDFNLNAVGSNETVSINCTLNLNGASVNLPSGVTLLYEGGDITNGTIVFSDGSVIDSDFLNHTLTIAGTTPRLSSPIFSFIPQRWGIVEGKVSDDIALKNKKILNNVIADVKKMEASTFEIDKMDAYFDVSSRVNNPKIKSEAAILIPSDFVFKMTNNTYLRVQPTNAHAYSLIMVYKGENITISGGNLFGDRWEHDYTPVVDLYGKTYYSHDWGHVTHVSGGKNVTLEGIKISNGAGDGFVVHGSDIRAKDGTPGNAIISENVTVRNCIIDASRRNGLSLLDGDGILVENCKIINTGQGENPSGVKFSSAGTWPKYGISFEAWRVSESDGTLSEYEKIENVTMRGNTFTGNAAGDIVLFACSNITIEDNYFDAMISNIASNSIIIRNNTMEARKNESGLPYEFGILLTSYISKDGVELNYNYEIYGNKINGYKNAMVLGGENYKINNNTLTNFKAGVTFYQGLNGAQLYDNTLTSSENASSGYTSLTAKIFDVSVKNENIEVLYRPINIIGLKADNIKNLTFDNCEFKSTGNKINSISGSDNITVQNSHLSTDINIVNSENIQLINNN